MASKPLGMEPIFVFWTRTAALLLNMDNTEWSAGDRWAESSSDLFHPDICNGSPPSDVFH